jgi:uncharacterized repeat protein (TIGR01451 family)
MNMINKIKSIFNCKWGRKIVSFVCATSMLGTILAPTMVSAEEIKIVNYPSFNFVNDSVINEKTETLKLTKSGEAWKDDVSNLKPGDTLSVYVYYHNGREAVINSGGNQTILPTIAYNTRLRVDIPDEMLIPANGVVKTKALAYVWSDNSKNYPPYDEHNPEGAKYAVDWGNITINSQNPVKFSFVQGSLKWYPDLNTRGTANPITQMPNNQNPIEILTEKGLNIGDITSCWEHRGVVTFQMKITEIGIVENPIVNLSETVDKATAKAGETLTYTISYENESNAVANDAKITAVYSLYGENIYDISNGGILQQTSRNIVWNLGNLVPRQKGTVSYKMKLTENMPEGTTTVVGASSITGSNFATKTAWAQTFVTKVPVQLVPNLSIKKYVSKDGVNWYNYDRDNQVLTANPGETLSYKVLVWNTGSGDATNVKVEDDVTTGNTNYYVNISPFDGNYGTVSATLNNSEAKAVSHTFTVQVNPAGFPLGNTEVRNVAKIVGNDQNNQIGASSSTKTSISANVALTLTNEVDKKVVERASEVTYTLTYGNLGNGIASGVILENTLPANAEYIKGSASGNALYSETEHKLIWNIGTLNPGTQNLSQTFRVRISNSVQNNENIIDVAQIRASGVEPIFAEAKSIAYVEDNTRPNLERSKSASATKVNPGEEVTFTITTRNSGNGIAKDVIVEDNLADVLEYSQIVRVTGSGILGADKVMRWPARNIQAGSQLVYQITVKVNNTLPTGKGYDYTMTNIYGNTVNVAINVPTPSAPTVLPPTGLDGLAAYALGIISLTGLILSGWKYLEERKKLKAALKNRIVLASLP